MRTSFRHEQPRGQNIPHSSRPGGASGQGQERSLQVAGCTCWGHGQAELGPAPACSPHPPGPPLVAGLGAQWGPCGHRGLGFSSLHHFGAPPGELVVPERTYLPWVCWGLGGWQTPHPHTLAAAAPRRPSDLGGRWGTLLPSSQTFLGPVGAVQGAGHEREEAPVTRSCHTAGGGTLC